MNPKALIGLAVIAAVTVSGQGIAATAHAVKGTALKSQDGLTCRTTIDARRDAGAPVSGTVRVEYDLQAIGMGHARCEARVDRLETRGGVSWLAAVVTRSSRPGMLPVGALLEMQVRDLGGGRLELLEGQMDVAPVEILDAPLDRAARR